MMSYYRTPLVPVHNSSLTMAALEVQTAAGPLLNSAFPDIAFSWVQEGLSVEVHLGGKMHVVTSLQKP